MIRHSLFLFFFLSALVGWAKNADSTFIEITSGGYQTWVVATFGQKGVVVSAYNYRKSSRRQLWEFRGFNAELEQKWKLEANIPKRQRFAYWGQDQNGVSLLFRDERKGDYTVIYANQNKQSLIRHQGTLIPGAHIESMQVLNGMVYLGGSFRKTPILAIIDIEEKRQRVEMPGVGKNQSLEVLRADTNQQRVRGFVRQCRQGICDLKVLQFNNNGERIEEITFTNEDEEHRLSTGSVHRLPDGSELLFGTWGGEKSNGIKGFFLAGIQRESVQFMEYYPLAELGERTPMTNRDEALQARQDPNENSSKIKGLSDRHQFLLHPIRDFKGQWMLVAEAYHRTYRTETYMATGANGQPVIATREIFDGFRFTHTLVASIGKDGKLLWHHVLPMESSKSITLRQRVHVQEQEASLLLTFPSGNRIVELNITSKKTNTERSGPIQFAPYPLEEDQEGSIFDSAYWFDSYWLSWGIQTKPSSKGANKRTEIFFIKRIERS